MRVHASASACASVHAYLQAIDDFLFLMMMMMMIMMMFILQDGVHTQEEAPPQYTDDQLKLMNSQDIRYVNYKRSTEIKVRVCGTLRPSVRPSVSLYPDIQTTLTLPRYPDYTTRCSGIQTTHAIQTTLRTTQVFRLRQNPHQREN